MTKSSKIFILFFIVLFIIVFPLHRADDIDQEDIAFEILPDYFNDIPQHLLVNPQDIKVAFNHLKTKDFLQIILFYKNIQTVHDGLDRMKIKDILKKRQGFFRFYALDCDEWNGKALSEDQQENIFCTSQTVQSLPYFWIVKPPLYEMNPYTKKPMEAKRIDFKEPKKDKDKIEDFILKNLPDFTVKASNQQDLMKKLDETQQLNTLILFTEKQKPSAFVKALSAQYKDRLQIAIINTKNQQPQIASKHDIIKYPKFMMAQNTKEGRKYHVYSGHMNLNSLKQFSENYALIEPIVRRNQQKEKSKQPKIFYTEVDSSNFLSQMTGTNKAVLVYFHKQQTDLKNFNKEIATKLDGPLRVVTVQCNEQNESIKRRLQAKKCPSYLFLQPGVTGKDKLLKARQIVNTSAPKYILQQIKAIYKLNAISIDPQNVSSYLSSILKSYQDFVSQQKSDDQLKPIQVTVIYYHKDESDLRLAFKALTTDPIFEGRIKFITVGGAGQDEIKVFNYKKLPAVLVFMPNLNYDKKQKNDDQGKNSPYHSIQYSKKIKYHQMHQFFSQFVPDVIAKQQAEEERINSEVVEIKNQEDFNKMCLSKGMICGIGILWDDGAGKLQDQISVVRDANKEVRGSNKYIYMYINASCHVSKFIKDIAVQKQLLKIFNLDASFLPTFVFYLPKHKKYSQMIGKFESSSIAEQLTKLVQGSVTNLYEMRSQFELNQENCQEQIFIENKSQQEIDMEKQILEDILAQQRQKKIDNEKEHQKSQKKKRKRKSRKSQKSKKKKKDKQIEEETDL